MSSVVVVNCELGNVGSILSMLRKVGAPAILTSDPLEIEKAERLILPGVGAFDHGMENIRRLGLAPTLHRKVLENRTPILGICLGMQLMTRSSEEGRLPGLGWFEAETVRFKLDPGSGLKIPHVGWNYVTPTRAEGLFRGATDETRYYFTHSFHVRVSRPGEVLARAEHGYEFDAAVHRENVYGVQFHPEKSLRHGIQLFRDFLEHCR